MSVAPKIGGEVSDHNLIMIGLDICSLGKKEGRGSEKSEF